MCSAWILPAPHARVSEAAEAERLRVPRRQDPPHPALELRLGRRLELHLNDRVPPQYRSQFRVWNSPCACYYSPRSSNVIGSSYYPVYSFGITTPWTAEGPFVMTADGPRRSNEAVLAHGSTRIAAATREPCATDARCRSVAAQRRRRIERRAAARG
jgi:hypothetical protein